MNGVARLRTRLGTIKFVRRHECWTETRVLSSNVRLVFSLRQDISQSETKNAPSLLAHQTWQPVRPAVIPTSFCFKRPNFFNLFLRG